MTQLDYYKEIVRLAEENPDMDLLLLVDNEEIVTDYRYTQHKILDVKVDWVWEDDDGSRMSGIKVIIAAMGDRLERIVSREEAEAVSKKTIVIYTTAA